MSKIISFNDKKIENNIKEINETIESFSEHIGNKMQANADKILTFSDKLYKALQTLKVQEGLDITIKNAAEDNFIYGIRKLNLIGDDVIVLGGYGADFKIYPLDNPFISLTDEEVKESQENNTNLIDTLYRKIVSDFLCDNVVIKIVKLTKNVETF